jgi:hypothetical protein
VKITLPFYIRDVESLGVGQLRVLVRGIDHFGAEAVFKLFSSCFAFQYLPILCSFFSVNHITSAGCINNTRVATLLALQMSFSLCLGTAQ